MAKGNVLDHATEAHCLRGMDLLHSPALNKGTAFTLDERTRLGLHGLLPPAVESLEEQALRAYEAFQRKTDDIERHIYLRALQDNNEILFYRLVLDHIEEMMPIVYTPVVASGCEQFSHIYRRPRGLFISYPLRDSIPDLLRNRPNRDVDVIVVTDGARILGIGDQGVGGLGIPIGKLSLYTLIGGIPPHRTLPIVLDVGTNNSDRLADPEYLGWRHERLTGDTYHEFIDLFVQAVKKELPDTCLQWEDFARPHARPILERYRDELLTFNDDIQGTASVTLGALLSAMHVAGTTPVDQHYVIFGAGSAAVGVADYLRAGLVDAGLSEQEARNRFWLVNRGGLLTTDRDDLNDEQSIYAHDRKKLAKWKTEQDGKIGLMDVIENVNTTVLIGLSTVGGAFHEKLIRTMASKVERPIIFPLSNPTSRSEATPEQLIEWTEGRALIATGSPFKPVTYKGKTYPIAQCNNVYIFPALGLGLVASRARRVTDGMLMAAAHALAAHSPAAKDPTCPLLPSLRDLRHVAVEIAVAVGLEAQHTGFAPPATEEELRAIAITRQWTPSYHSDMAS